jgi:hypothetical protein
MVHIDGAQLRRLAALPGTNPAAVEHGELVARVGDLRRELAAAEQSAAAAQQELGAAVAARRAAAATRRVEGAAESAEHDRAEERVRRATERVEQDHGIDEINDALELAWQQLLTHDQQHAPELIEAHNEEVLRSTRRAIACVEDSLAELADLAQRAAAGDALLRAAGLAARVRPITEHSEALARNLAAAIARGEETIAPIAVLPETPANAVPA